MKITKIIAVVFLVAITFFGCKKEAIDINPELEGWWRTSPGSSSNISLHIGSGKSEFIHAYPGEKKLDAYGKAKIKDDILYIGKFNGHIDLYPSYDQSGNYIIKVQEKTYFGALYPESFFAHTRHDTAFFVWSAGDNNSSKIILDYKLQSAVSWTTKEVTKSIGTTYVAGLLPMTAYEWRIKSVTGQHESRYTPVQTFTTQ